jgi:2-polyprenyl-3-methyl-5-hydroxy-6-metoxy-1,4-benzoquinol methylase
MVVSFSKLGNHGRIGNCLFQWGATLGIAERNNAEASFPAWNMEKFFDTKLNHNGLASKIYKEQNYHYDEIRISTDTDLFGYFQSSQYFPAGWKPAIRSDIVQHHRENKVFEKETIAIHVRRGDYVNHDCYYQLPITWYINALLSIPNWRDCNILFFSDDMEYLKVHFECLQNAHFITGFEIDHLCLMSLCDHHIVGNSTYAWWGAYLSEQKDVIHSGKMFRGPFAYKDIKDFYPPNWKKFADEKIDLKDVTFTIPVLWDHNDRKQNFDLTLCILQKDFDTNIIVGEQGKEKKFEYSSKWAKYKYFELKEFHRTKMLNDMAIQAETEIIANYDTDVIIPPMQIYLAVELLRGGVDCVYPYDGRFARMDRLHWFRKVESHLDIGCVGKAPLEHRHVRESVGGAVMWRKEAFIDFGMENEYMISYAPEDVERWERMHTLNVNVQRVNGTLYHMNHFKGIDSHNGNPNFPKSKLELAKMRAMSKDEMRAYVDSWPWRHKYTEAYYHRISEGAVRSAQETIKVLQNHWHEGWGESTHLSVIDIGCGVGEWSKGFLSPNYIGVDHNIPEKALMIPKEQYFDIDLETAVFIEDDGSSLYDLCICLEVAEHISEGRADWLIYQLCHLSDNVLFSAAIPNQGGTGHINEQWQEYWAEKFYSNGFGAELCYPVKDNPNVELWYRQNMILYKRGASGKVFNFVLPEYYTQITNYLKNK